MRIRCAKCKRMYDDAEQWTICPHSPLGGPIDDYCPKCDTCLSLHGLCMHQLSDPKVAEQVTEKSRGMAMEGRELATVANNPFSGIVGDRPPKLTTMSVEELKLFLNGLALIIEELLPAGDSAHGSMFFALVIADNDEYGSMARFVSNCDREDAIDLLHGAANNLRRNEGHKSHKKDQT